MDICRAKRKLKDQNERICSVSNSRGGGDKGRLTLVQFNGLFNKTITPITRSTKHREGINPNENALKTQLIRLQLHIIQVH